MASRPIRPALVLAAWTFLVWTTRIRNIWTDDALTTGGQVWRTALAGIFTVFAVGVVVLWRRRSDVANWVRAFAVWTIGVWAIRAVQIGLADHGVAFKLVHTVLAVVSVGLALWADRAAHETATERTSRPTPV
ncbi:MAG: hypothetical protein OSA99_00940 [Acidimicrobiales bacterium]|nr:hypothetical protein [Acidimicrobiales bacterium]